MYRFRVLHLSDVHFRSADGALPQSRREQVRREEWRRHRILGDAFREEIRRAVTETPVDVVCFTGDAADWGQPGEFDQATGFLQKVLEDVGLQRERLFIVPGNHDIDRTINPAAWQGLRQLVQSQGEAALSDWIAGGPAPIGVDPSLHIDTVERLSAYRDWLQRLGRSELLPSAHSHRLLGYRVTLEIPRLPFPIQIIGLDSAWLAGDDHDDGKLMLTQDQIGHLGTGLRGGALPGFRLALVHHPLSQLADANSARGMLADCSDLVLRGHQHDPLMDVWRSPDRRLVELAAGCLYDGGRGHRYPNGYAIVEVVAGQDGRPLSIEVHLRTWSNRGHWHSDGSLYRSAPNGRMSIMLDPQSPTLAQPPMDEELSKELTAQWTACRRAHVSFQTYHKLEVLFRIAPAYMASVFDAADPSVGSRIEEWLRRQSEKHALAPPTANPAPIMIENDTAVSAARGIARLEGASTVDVRHVLLAILADESSNTVRELRRSLENLNVGAFAKVREAAEKLSPQAFQPRSNLSTLDLTGDR